MDNGPLGGGFVGTGAKSYNDVKKRRYPQQVEQWRPLLAKYFPSNQIDKMLWVIQHESGGNPSSVGDGGASVGLFQSQSSRDSLATPEAQVQDAYGRWMKNGYKDWGENNSYHGRKFGSLGNNPYPGDAPQGAGTDLTKGPLGGGFHEGAMPSQPKPEDTAQRQQQVQADAKIKAGVTVPNVGDQNGLKTAADNLDKFNHDNQIRIIQRLIKSGMVDRKKGADAIIALGQGEKPTVQLNPFEKVVSGGVNMGKSLVEDTKNAAKTVGTAIARDLPGGMNDIKAQQNLTEQATRNITMIRALEKQGKIPSDKANRLIQEQAGTASQGAKEVGQTVKSLPSTHELVGSMVELGSFALPGAGKIVEKGGAALAPELAARIAAKRAGTGVVSAGMRAASSAIDQAPIGAAYSGGAAIKEGKKPGEIAKETLAGGALTGGVAAGGSLVASGVKGFRGRAQGPEIVGKPSVALSEEKVAAPPKPAVEPAQTAPVKGGEKTTAPAPAAAGPAIGDDVVFHDIKDGKVVGTKPGQYKVINEADFQGSRKLELQSHDSQGKVLWTTPESVSKVEKGKAPETPAEPVTGAQKGAGRYNEPLPGQQNPPDAEKLWEDKYAAKAEQFDKQQTDLTEQLKTAKAADRPAIRQQLDQVNKAAAAHEDAFLKEGKALEQKATTPKPPAEMPPPEATPKATGKTVKQLREENRSTTPRIAAGEVFSYPTTKLKNQIQYDKFIENETKLPTEDVPVNKMVPTQRIVNADHLEKMKNVRSAKDNIIVVEKNGRYFILDGHHRIANAIIRGDQTVSARVVKEGVTQAERPKGSLKPLGKNEYVTAHEGGKAKVVKGEPVKLVKGVDTFVHKGDGGWIVSEAKSGRYLATSVSKDGAIAKARSNINDVGEEKFKQLIAEKQLKTPKEKPVGKPQPSEPVTAEQALSELKAAKASVSEGGYVKKGGPIKAPKAGKLKEKGVQFSPEYEVKRPLFQRVGLMPTRGYAKLDPAAGKIVRIMTSAHDYEYARAVEQGEGRLRHAFSGLNQAERAKIVDLQERGLPPEEVKKLPAKYRRAIQEGIQWFNTEIEKIAREEFGVDTSKWQYDSSNYFHHMFTGDQAVLVNDKIAFIGKRADALRKADELIKKGTDPDTISMKPRFTQNDVPTTLLSQKGFWTFVNKMAKSLDVTGDDILQEIQGVAATKPRPTFVGAFKSRRANMEGYIKDPEYVYDRLWNRINRKRYLEPAAKQAYNELPNIKTPWLKNEMEQYIKDVRGFYRDPDYLLGINVSKLAQYMTKFNSIFKLGYRPRTAIINRLQPLQTAWSDLGRYYFLGEGKKYGAEARQVVDEIGAKTVPGKYEVGAHPLYRINTSTNPIKPLGAFQMAEGGNRAAVSYGAYLKGLHAGMDHETAIQYARAFDNAANFSYSVAGLPKAFQNAYVKVLLQFRPFAINYLHNFQRTVRGKPLAGLEEFEKYFPLTKTEKTARAVRFITANMLLGGVKFIASPLVQGTLAYTAIQHPKIFQGVLANFGIDISSTAGVDPTGVIPTKLEDFPAGSDLANFVQAIQKYRQTGDPHDLEKLLKLNAAGYDVYKALTTNQDASPSAALSTRERVLQGLGFTPSKVSTSRLAMQQLGYKKPDLKTASGLPTAHAVILMVKNLNDPKYDPKKKDIIRALFKTLDISEADFPDNVKTGDAKDAYVLVNDALDKGDIGKAKELAAKYKVKLTEARIRYHTKIKKQQTGNIVEDGTHTDKSILGTIGAYASAFKTSPLSAFHDIFTGQRILRTTNGAIIVERMSLAKSSQLKKELQNKTGSTTVTLDHILPLELGGTNDLSNLELVDKKQAAKDDKIENRLGSLLGRKKISAQRAKQLMLDYKHHKISADEIMRLR